MLESNNQFSAPTQTQEQKIKSKKKRRDGKLRSKILTPKMVVCIDDNIIVVVHFKQFRY